MSDKKKDPLLDETVLFPDDLHNFGLMIRLIMSAKGWTQADACERLNISAPTMKKAENNVDIKMSTFLEFLDKAGVELELKIHLKKKKS